MSPRARLSIALVSTCLVGYVALGSLLGRVLGDSTYGQLALFNEVVSIVLNSYVDPVNVDRAMLGARMGLTEALDGDTAWLDEEEFEAYTKDTRTTEADIGLTLTRRFSFLFVVAPRAGSPAEKAGLRSGDALKSIDGKHSRVLSVPAAQRLLRGAPGSMVKLTVLRSGADPREVTVVRERLAPAPIRGRMLADGAAHLRVSELAPRSGEEVRAELEKLRRAGARSLVLDLRGAAYGAPADAVAVAELFLKGGVVAKLAGSTVAEQVLTADPARAAWALPVAVIVDRGSAGAAELVAAALLDAGRAPLVGQRTFGRAAVQRPVPLEQGGLVVTVARYLTPKGEVIHGKGVEPSVAVEAPDEDDLEEGQKPASDVMLEKALEVLRTPEKKAA
jgi:carboxyl-terminal processing protease